MPSTAPWARFDPRIRLMINGQEMPCVRCNVDYELNAIPQASATLAVGRGFDGQASPVHALADSFVDRAPAQIFINPYALGQDARSYMQPDDLSLPGTEVMIFDGFVTAAGFTRSRGSAQFNIYMEHWLSELGFSSIFSKTSHPMNPGQFSYGALSPTGGAGSAWTNLTLSHNFITEAAVINDFWGGGADDKIGLKPFFKFICSEDAFWSTDPAMRGFGANDGALAAINRFDSKYQQLLAIDLRTDADLANNIAQHVSLAVGEAGLLANQTLWDVLVGAFASSYLFKIVPRVKDAIVAPFVEGYRTPFATITANEETQIEWMRGLGRPLRGLGVLADATCATGCTLPAEGAPPELGIGGFYAPNRDATTGIIVMKTGPSWMNRLYSPSLSSHESTGVAGNVIGTAPQPGAPQVNNVADEVTARVQDVVRPFLDKYAKTLYALEKLRSRQAVCSGPFRLDIAPGSTVKVETTKEPFIPEDQLAATFYAHVTRVSLAVDGEQPSIGTSFHLSHVRSEKENTQDTTSVLQHPLYKDTFAGCTLVDL